jgi:hypothetical protein
MKTTLNCSRLIATLTAVAIFGLVQASASAEEPYQKVTVAELKRIMKEQAEEQKRLEVAPEYQGKKQLEEANRKRLEQEKLQAKENDLLLRMQAADLERMKLENKRLANPPATNDGGSGGGASGDPITPTVLDVPRLMVDPRHFPFGWFGKPTSTKSPGMPGFKPTPQPQPAIRIR